MNADNIKDLFNPEKIEFLIPDYQRAYSWEDKNIRQFIEDIEDNNTYKKQYYLGHYLFERNPLRPEQLFVIDGQQRLTTIVIFMSCVYFELKKRSLESPVFDEDGDEINVERIREDFLKYSKFYKLSTVSDDNPFFESVIYKNSDTRPKNQSQIRIAAAKSKFSKWLVGQKTEDIIAYKNIIAEATITTYEVKDKYQATQIFAFQNDRGKDLTELEKLKAEIMHKIYTYADGDDEASHAVNHVKTQFAEIFKSIEQLQFTDEDSVLNAHNLAFYPYEQTAMSFLKKGVKEEKEDVVEWIKEFTNDILKSYTNMLRIEEKFKYDSKIADIQILDKYSSTPLLLKLMKYHDEDEDFIEYIAGLVERILFKLTYSFDEYRTNRLITIAKDYHGDKEALISNLIYCANFGFKPYWDFSQSCHRYFTDINYHYNGWTKYVLWKYENSLRYDKGLKPISAEIFVNQFGRKREENTLDHITPQNPNFTQYTEEFSNNWLNNIGNICLMGWGNNSSKGCNNPADYKDYYDSDYISMKKVYNVLCEKGKWEEEEIRERLAEIVDFVDRTWVAQI